MGAGASADSTDRAGAPGGAPARAAVRDSATIDIVLVAASEIDGLSLGVAGLVEAVPAVSADRIVLDDHVTHLDGADVTNLDVDELRSRISAHASADASLGVRLERARHSDVTLRKPAGAEATFGITFGSYDGAVYVAALARGGAAAQTRRIPIGCRVHTMDGARAFSAGVVARHMQRAPPGTSLRLGLLHDGAPRNLAWFEAMGRCENEGSGTFEMIESRV